MCWKTQIQEVKGILRLDLVKKEKSEGRKLQLFLGNPKWLSCLARYQKQLLCMPYRVISRSNSHVPSSLSPPCLVMSLVWCFEPCCPGWNLDTVSKLVFLTWQHMMRLVGNLPYPFFVKHQSWCLTLNPGTRTGRVKCTAELRISAGCLCAFFCSYCLWLILRSCGDRMTEILLFPFIF